MDPIAAYRKQQERNNGTSSVEQSIPQLREANPRWAMIFDRVDTSGNGTLELDEVRNGFRHILGAGSVVPEHFIKDIFAQIDEDGSGNIDFKEFCNFSKRVSAHMMDHPRWAQEEEAITAEEEKQRKQQEKAKREKEGPDIFAVLGLKISKEMAEADARKKQALANARAARASRMQGGGSLANLGSSIVRSGSQGGLTRPFSASKSDEGAHPLANRMTVRRSSMPSGLTALQMEKGLASVAGKTVAVGRFASGLKRSQMSIDSNVSAASAQPEDEEEPISPTKKLREAWDRFSLSSARGRTQRTLTNVRHIHLPDMLPQIRALGKRNAGCNTLRFSPDGSQLAGGFFDGGIRIFDVDRGSQVQCMNLPKYKGGSVKSIEELKRDEQNKERDLLLGRRDSDNDAMLEETPMELDDVDIANLMKKWDPVSCLRWQPRSAESLSCKNVLASVDTKGELAFWDVPRCRELRPSRCLGQVDCGAGLTSLAWTSDGSGVAVAGEDKIIKLYDVGEDTGKAVFTSSGSLGQSVAYCGKCTGHTLKIVSLCAHPSTPQVLISAGLDQLILIWDTRVNDQPVHQLLGPELAGDAIDISKDGFSLLTASHRTKNPLEIYDLRQSEEAKPTYAYSWRGNEQASEGGGKWTSCLLFTAGWDEWENKTVVAAGENENLARIYERSSDSEEPLKIVGTIRGKETAFWSSAISTEGRTAAFGSADGAVCLVDVIRK